MGEEDTGGESGCDRHCAPKGIAILDALTESMLEGLPKVADGKKDAKRKAAAPKAKKAKAKKAKSAKF